MAPPGTGRLRAARAPTGVGRPDAARGAATLGHGGRGQGEEAACVGTTTGAGMLEAAAGELAKVSDASNGRTRIQGSFHPLEYMKKN